SSSLYPLEFIKKTESDKMVKFLAPIIFTAVVTVICADLQKDFTDLSCKGTYDESKMSAVVGVCNDCFELFGEDSLQNLCR
ncbi:hypothetical protein AVEN_211727-1, partial [Araneus ventricosus]